MCRLKQEDLVNYRMHLRTKRFNIRTLEPSDVGKEYAEWFADSRSLEFIRWANEHGSDVQATLKEYVKGKLEATDALMLGIWHTNGSHIGNIKFEPLVLKTSSAWLGVLIGPKQWRGQHVFREAFSRLAPFLSYEFGTRSIHLGVSRRNLYAIRAYENAGFRFDAELGQGKQLGDDLYMTYDCV